MPNIKSNLHVHLHEMPAQLFLVRFFADKDKEENQNSSK